jgi:hypothetical protein
MSSRGRREKPTLSSPLKRSNFNQSIGDRQLPVAMPSLRWKNLSSTWKHVVLKPPAVPWWLRPARQTVPPVSSLWSFMLMTCRASSAGAVVKSLTTSKLTRVPTDWRLTNFNNCTKRPEFLSKDPECYTPSSESFSICYLDMNLNKNLLFRNVLHLLIGTGTHTEYISGP